MVELNVEPVSASRSKLSKSNRRKIEQKTAKETKAEWGLRFP
jgi:hypothetical protein